ncbi:right-handed parallel beta-helix repeat-containing protein [Natrinema gelatinilyticum]|uniref:right-handed parallel beta-helix repeat-containing protein n=1 Tax=Natrinema gelatinilyticum TaxID=2961571 RepID=UPI0020C50F2F|nr:right-handed parallel beta-helix repeat-containing protein [Natrinema gelatinilyticum]
MRDSDPDGPRIRRRSYLYGSVAAVSGLAGCLGARDDRTARKGTGEQSTAVHSGNETTDERVDGGDDEATDAVSITECTTITEPGTYVLAADLEAGPGETCIEIRASDVTLDGRGRTITGSGRTEPLEEPFEPATTGVLVRPTLTAAKKKRKKAGVTVPLTDGLSNVTVQNLTVQGFDAGITFEGVTGGEISGTTMTTMQYGLLLIKSSENTLRGNESTGNDRNGIRLERANGNLLEANTANDNGLPGGTGITLAESHENRLVGNDVDGNISGLELNRSHGNRLEENSVSGNIFDGIVLLGSRANSLVGNAVNSNTNLFGVILFDSHETTLEENTVNGNAQGGITLVEADDNTLVGNTANRNGFDGGIVLTYSDGNTLSNNTANGNIGASALSGPDIDPTLGPGFNLFDSSANRGRANTARGNDGGPINIVGGEGNSIEINGVVYTEATADGTPRGTDEQPMLSDPLEVLVETGEREQLLETIDVADAELPVDG